MELKEMVNGAFYIARMGRYSNLSELFEIVGKTMELSGCSYDLHISVSHFDDDDGAITVVHPDDSQFNVSVLIVRDYVAGSSGDMFASISVGVANDYISFICEDKEVSGSLKRFANAFKNVIDTKLKQKEIENGKR